ncbi:MAG: NDP-sugar synthase, partial [Elusimicrobia bacterium]|nr:NDP-sugar synthase [Elusimicrobiota bacterium]
EGGVTDAILACGKATRPFESDFRKIAPKGLRLHFAYEPSPLGTGGAIRFAYDELKRRVPVSGPVVVFNGDVFFELNIRKFAAFHRSRRSDGTIALTRVDDVSRFGVVKTDRRGQVQKFIEKPQRPVGTNFVNAGAYLLESDWIERIPSGTVVSIERDSFPDSLRRRGRLFGFSMAGYWNDIGTIATYLQAHADLASTRNRWTGGMFSRKSGRAVIGAGGRVGRGVTFSGFVCLGPNVMVGDGASLKDVVVLEGTRIGAGVRAERTIIGRRCRIGANCDLSAGTALGDDSKITDYTRC